MLPHLLKFVDQHRLMTFFVLSYLFAWFAVPFRFFIPAGPLIAALVVVGVTDGWAGLRAWGARCIQWRVGWQWYGAALGLPLMAAVAATALNVALGASWSPAHLPAWSTLVVVFALRLIDPLDGPLGEEPGWRGYGLPGLQARQSPLVATLILGLLVAGWHLPLIWLGQLPTIGLLGTIAVTFLYTWLFNRAGGSAFLTLVMHAAEGTFFRFAVAGYGNADTSRAVFLYFVMFCIIAVSLVVFDRQAWRTTEPVTPATPSPQPA